MNPTNWAPGLIVLGAGLLTGVLFVLLSRRGPGQNDAGALLADLDERYRSLIAQLKELMASRHQLPAVRFEAEKIRLEQAAANALRARDQFVIGKHEADKAAVRAAKMEQVQAAGPGPGPGMMPPQLRTALIVGGAVVFFVVVGLMLSQESKTRDDGAGMTGMAAGRPMQRPPEQTEDPDLTAAMARLTQTPDDLEALASTVHLLLVRDDYVHAASLTERSMGIDPFHPETRVHRAVIQAVKGDSPGALKELLHLADTFPNSNEALLFAGAVAMQMNDKAKALEAFERFWAVSPPSERSPRLRQQIDQLRAEVAAMPAAAP